MIRKLKALGVAFVAISALSAVAASAAQAGTFDIASDPAVITGVSHAQYELRIQKQTPQAGGNFNAKCQSHTAEGTVVQDFQGSQQIHELQLTTTIGTGQGDPSQAQGCTLFGQKAQVLMNGCKDTFTGVGHPANTFNVDIVGCTAGKQITIQSAFCQVVIPEQTEISHAVGTNLGNNPHEVTLETTAGGITHTQFGAACPDGNNHHSANASLTGSMILKAYQDAGTHQVTRHLHQYDEITEGVQINITST